jgi:hypothetical protein
MQWKHEPDVSWIHEYISYALFRVKQPITQVKKVYKYTQAITFTFSNIKVTLLYKSPQELKVFSKAIAKFAPWANDASIRLKTPKLHFVLINLLHSKSLDPNAKSLDRSQVQTGVTGIEPYSDRILLYRLEELSKTMIHEVVHHSKFDSNGKYSNGLISKLLSKILGTNGFNCDSCVNVNESVVEFWSIILHSYYYSKWSGLDFITVLNFEIITGWITTGMLCNYFKSVSGTNSYMPSYLLIRMIIFDSWYKILPMKQVNPNRIEKIIKTSLQNQNVIDKINKYSTVPHEKTFRLSFFAMP